MNLAYVWIYLSSVIVFVLVDSVWLKSMTQVFYQPRIGHLLSDKPNMLAAAVFYLFYLFALCVLVIYPQLKAHAPLWQFFAMGALIGLMAYGTFDFTALALFKNYSTSAALVDFAWGGIITGTVAVSVGGLGYKFGWLV